MVIDGESLQELGDGPSEGRLATVHLTATVQAAADAPDGDLEIIVTLTHPKFLTETSTTSRTVPVTKPASLASQVGVGGPDRSITFADNGTSRVSPGRRVTDGTIFKLQ